MIWNKSLSFLDSKNSRIQVNEKNILCSSTHIQETHCKKNISISKIITYIYKFMKVCVCYTFLSKSNMYNNK